MTKSKNARQLRAGKRRIGWPVRVCPYAPSAALFIALAPYAAYADEDTPKPPPDATTPAESGAIAPLTTTTPAQTSAPKLAPAIQNKPTDKPADKPVSMPESTESSSKLPTDHELVVGAIGIGYIGTAHVLLPTATPVGRGDQAGMSPNDKLNLTPINIPTLGLRKWFNRRRGIDAGVGLYFSGGSRGAQYGKTSSNVDKASVFGISVHGGVPIMVADTRHMAFMVIPEATLSFAGSNIAAEFTDNAPPNVRVRAGELDVGMRAGAEVHFGFIGLPRLTLQAGVGIYLSAQWASASESNQSISDTSVKLSFGSAGNPWDIFSGVANMSARYYF